MLKAKDYRTELEPVWCNRCGDFGVLKGLTTALADLQVPPEKLAVVSGIGCSSRLPGYVKAYSFNTVHGRALPIATGLKAARPELTVVVVGGDGDGFSIGLGHVPHAIRRNLKLTYVVLDNGIYGLTKGQASPTTSPDVKRALELAGQDDAPLNPVFLVLASGCGFVARAHAGNLPHLRQTIREALEYPGFAFVHVLAACVTYQPQRYAEELYARTRVLPADHDPTDLAAALRTAMDTTTFALGVIHRRPADLVPGAPPAEDGDPGHGGD